MSETDTPATPLERLMAAHDHFQTLASHPDGLAAAMADPELRQRTADVMGGPGLRLPAVPVMPPEGAVSVAAATAQAPIGQVPAGTQPLPTAQEKAADSMSILAFPQAWQKE